MAAWVRPIMACGASLPQWPWPSMGSHSPRQNDTWWPLYGHSMIVYDRKVVRLRSLLGRSNAIEYPQRHTTRIDS